MILRSIANNIKKQNWSTVLVEIIIVIVGVFIGLEVSLWNEERQDRADSVMYQNRLVEDLELSITTNNRNISTSQKQIAGMDMILKTLATCELPKEQEGKFLEAIYNVGKYNMPVMITGTIDELNSTGKYPLIGDIELRRMINDILRRHQVFIDVDPQIVGRITPSINYTRTRVSFLLNEAYWRSENKPHTVDYDFQVMCNDKEFFRAIAMIREMTLSVAAFNQSQINSQANLKAAILEKLGTMATNAKASE